MIRRIVYITGRETWRFLMTPAAKKGTWSAEISGLVAALIMGLISWWLYTHR